MALRDLIEYPELSVISTRPSKSIGHRIPDGAGGEVVYIDDYAALQVAQVLEYKAVILDYSNKEACEQFVKEMRKSSLDQLYLKPIFLLAISAPQNPFLMELVDGVIPAVQLAGISHTIKQINQRVAAFSTADAPEGSPGLLIKAVRYLASRDTKLVPIVDVSSPLGYSYPILNVSCKGNQYREVIEAIELGIKENLFSQEFVDRLHLCPKCSSSFLNIRESCPSCSSMQLKNQNMIHHFVCAYIGPEADFVHGDELQCPKCNHTLRHIGIDYDKPSQVCTCQSCNKTTQDPEVKAFCFSCAHESRLDRLVDFDVQKLELTSQGLEASHHEYGRKSKQKEEIAGCIPFDTYSLFIQHEIERVKISGMTSSAGVMLLQLSSVSKAELGYKINTLFKEVAEVLHPNLPMPNLMSVSIQNNALLFLFPNVQQKVANQFLADFKATIGKLLLHNMPGTECSISVETLPLSEGCGTANEVIEKLLS